MGIDGLDLDLMLSRRCEEFSAIHLTSLHSWLVQIHQQRYFLKNGPKVMITNPLDRQKFNIPYLTHPQYECPNKKTKMVSSAADATRCRVGPAAGHNSPACLAVSEDLRAAQRANSPRKCHSEALVNSYELMRQGWESEADGWWIGVVVRACADCNLQMQVESIGYPLVILHSYWTWPLIVEFPIKNCDFP